ncbi:MAG TPA: hypothetical protein DDY58_11460 [Terrisporobacter glycolicus]|nr:hypothetical protein [Terrisporobacter hibernicus]
MIHSFACIVCLWTFYSENLNRWVKK